MPGFTKDLYALAAALGVALSWTAPALAKNKYWIDDVMTLCHQHARSNLSSAIAYSDTGIFSCSWNQPDIQTAETKAIRSCQAELPLSAKNGAPCRIIVKNKKVTDRNTVRKLQSHVRLLSTFEIYDKKSGNVQKLNGYIELGRLAQSRSRRARLVTNAGLLLCDGTFTQARNFLSLSLLCFDEFQFEKSGIPPRNYTLSDGVYKPNFQVRLVKDGSYLAINSNN